MKLYVISGLGADKTVFENIVFPKKFSEIVFIDWLIPEAEETFEHFVRRMADLLMFPRNFLFWDILSAVFWCKKSIN